MTANRFLQRLQARWAAGLSISVGLDGEIARFPAELQAMDERKAMVEFHRQVIVGTADLAAAFKPNIAFYESMGTAGLQALHDVMELLQELAPDVPVVIDAKRADIGHTNEHYARAVFDDLGADAVTVSPYLGPEAMKPFLDRDDRGIIVLCRTSNPGAGRYQDLVVDGRPLYQHVAADVASTWNTNGNCGLVVGATYPDEMQQVRTIVGDLPILVPGVGAQGGDVAATLTNGRDANGHGLMLHSGRAIMYAFAADGHASQSVEGAARAEIQALQAEILAVP